MSLEHLSTNQPSLFAEPESAGASPAPRVRSARSANRAAWWEQDLSRTATYLMGQARSEDERAFVERLYDEAMAEGPDFINYRGKSAFLAAPRLGIDRNAYARILNALEAIERGTYRSCREKGKQGIPRTVARVLKALLNLALQYGEVRPSSSASRAWPAPASRPWSTASSSCRCTASSSFTGASSVSGRRSASRWCRTPTPTRGQDTKVHFMPLSRERMGNLSGQN